MRNQMLCAIAAMATLFIVNGCQKPVIEPPVLTLETTEFTATADGGSVSVPFELKNATEGAVVSVEPVVECAWAEVTNVGESSIELSIAKNETTESRTAEFTVSYPGISKDSKFTVTQEAGEPVEVTFELSVSNITTETFTFSIIPSDKDMTYFYMSLDQPTLEELGIVSGGVLDKDKLYAMCKEYYLNDEYMPDFSAKGDLVDAEGYGMSSEVMYLFCFGVDTGTMEKLTDVFYTEFTMESSPATLRLDESELNVAADGGKCGTYYYREGDFGEGAVTAVSDVDWITVSVDEDEKYIECIAEPNDTPEARMATVTVSHPSVAESAIFTVNQAAGEPAEVTFDISVYDITAESFTYDIVPSDKDMTYFHLFMSQAGMEQYGIISGGVLDGEKLYEMCKEYYMIDDYTLEMFSAKGDLKGAYGVGSSSEVMYVFCFGYDPDTKEKLSDVFYSDFKMESLPASITLDESEFNVAASGYKGGTTYYKGGDFGEGSITAVPDVDWVTASVDESIRYVSFEVAANDTPEARTATITVSHPSVAEPAIITINQAAGE